MINPLPALILFQILVVLVSFGFGFMAGYNYRKESEALWSEDDIHDMMNNTD